MHTTLYEFEPDDASANETPDVSSSQEEEEEEVNTSPTLAKAASTPKGFLTPGKPHTSQLISSTSCKKSLSNSVPSGPKKTAADKKAHQGHCCTI